MLAETGTDVPLLTGDLVPAYFIMVKARAKGDMSRSAPKAWAAPEGLRLFEGEGGSGRGSLWDGPCQQKIDGGGRTHTEQGRDQGQHEHEPLASGG